MKNKNSKKINKVYLLIFIFVVSLFFAPILDILLNILLNKFGIFSAFIIGIFYSFSITSGAVSVMIQNLTDNYLYFSAIAALGSMTADFTILKIIKLNFQKEVHTIFKKLKLNKLNNKLKTFLGFLIIGSPLPDELGLLLISEGVKINKIKLMAATYSVNFIFIYFITRI